MLEYPVFPIDSFSKGLRERIESSNNTRSIKEAWHSFSKRDEARKRRFLILHPFKEAIHAFQKKHESISEVISGYQHMVNTMSDLVMVNSKITYCKGMAKSSLCSLNERLSYVLKNIYVTFS